MLLAWQDRSAVLAGVEKVKRQLTLGLLGRGKVLVRDMAALTGIELLMCERLLRLPVESHDGSTGC